MASTVWRGYVSFGLISIPVRLFRAARAEKIGFRRVYRKESPGAETENPAPERPSRTQRDGPVPPEGKPSRASLFVEPEIERRESRAPEPVFTRVRQSAVDLQEKTVRPESIVKGYEFEKDRFVEVGREELKSLAPKTSTAMQIEEFVQLAEVDPVYFETSYYVVPEQAGERAYALLYKSMLNTGLVAVANLAMHAREHIVILRPGRTGLLAHTMFFTNEVHADEEYRADVRLVADKELGLAETLIRSLNQPFEPEKYRDTYRERLESLLAQKVENLPAAPAIAEPRKTAEVLDIAEALRRSLANLKKPAGSAEPTVKPTGDSRKRKSQRSSKRGKTA